MIRDDQLAYTIPDAADILSIGRPTLYAQIADGKIQTITIGRRRLVTRKELEAYLDRLSATDNTLAPVPWLNGQADADASHP
mgnify:FL=1